MARNRNRALAELAVRLKAGEMARDVRRLESSQRLFNQAISEAREAGMNEAQIVREMEKGTSSQADREALTRYIGQAAPTTPREGETTQ